MSPSPMSPASEPERGQPGGGEHETPVTRRRGTTPRRWYDRSVSIIVPMLNEARHVANLVADVAAQDYPGGIELIVADGGSEDGSVEILERAAHEHGVRL